MINTLWSVSLPVALAPGHTITLVHGLQIGGVPKAPRTVLPDNPTGIAVDGVPNDMTVTFKNLGFTYQEANFLCQISYTGMR